MWSAEAGLTVFPPPWGYAEGEAYDVNDANQIVGHVEASGPTRGFIYDAGTWTMIEPLADGLHTDAHAINNNGTVVGLRTSNGAFPWLAYAYRDGRYTDIYPMRGNRSVAQAVNDSGQVAGWMGFTEDSTLFLWQDGRTEDLGRPKGSTHLYVSSISNDGMIVGWAVFCSVIDEPCRRPFYWWQGEFHIIEGLQGALPQCSAYGVNDRHQIVASCYNGPGYLYENGVAYELDDLIKYSGPPLTLQDPAAINKHSMIVGDTGASQGYLLKPIAMTPGDVNGDCAVDMLDLMLVIEAWGQTASIADVDGSEVVDIDDLFAVLMAWT
jgi:uncharacterized membrane protein